MEPLVHKILGAQTNLTMYTNEFHFWLEFFKDDPSLKLEFQKRILYSNSGFIDWSFALPKYLQCWFGDSSSKRKVPIFLLKNNQYRLMLHYVRFKIQSDALSMKQNQLYFKNLQNLVKKVICDREKKIMYYNTYQSVVDQELEDILAVWESILYQCLRVQECPPITWFSNCSIVNIAYVLLLFIVIWVFILFLFKCSSF